MTDSDARYPLVARLSGCGWQWRHAFSFSLASVAHQPLVKAS